MRHQTKSFIVEIRQSRKLKPSTQKSSIWGERDLSISEDHVTPANPVVEPAAVENGDQR
ncbi:hypothetical protein [Rhizobium sp. GR12]|uniref:hypothetical protein n=1 Tax=Rhizobium TaxID=379 RepID=UPI002FBD4E3B